jgi:hypothetical protein
MFAIGERASSLGWTPSQDIPDGKNFTLFPWNIHSTKLNWLVMNKVA